MAADNLTDPTFSDSAEQEESTGQAPELQLPEDPTTLLFHAPDFSQLPKRPARPINEDFDEDEDDDDHRSSRSRRQRRNQPRRKQQDHRGDRSSRADHEHDDEEADNQSEKTSADHRPGRSTGTSATDKESNEPVARRRRKRRRGKADIDFAGGSEDDPENTITRVRAPRQATGGSGNGEVTALRGSTRLEAKRQRRRDNRRGRRRGGHIVTEAEFLARRESVERKMMVRQRENRIQIGVMEDGVLAEHFVSNTTQDSLIGNIYLGKVQNVLPSMEAAFVDIGRGRNAVLYAGEVNWDANQLDGKAKKIENALKSGDTVLVQVTKDPVDHKGARLTGQISLPGRYLVYVPGGSMTGISRKLPDVERNRLKKILKEHLPDKAGVIVRTAAEGTSEQELMNDINRLRAQWEEIEEASKSNKVTAPELLHSEPDLTIKVIRDVFNEDFTSMVVQGEEVWDKIEAYVTYVAPDLRDRMTQWIPENENDEDLFERHRIDEQLRKAMERKVNLPSGGSLVIDRTEAMTVVDINTGKFTGSGGNLEETVTKNNLEAAEEIVRQLRLRDIGGIIVIDFIDMVLENNRDLVLRRLVECLGRDRTKHQVSEVTSLGLVQMTRKRMGTGLVEVFSETCEHCAGRGIILHDHPVEKGKSYDSHGNLRRRSESRRGRRRRQHDHQDDMQDQTQQPDAEVKETEAAAPVELTEEQKREQAEKEAKAAQNRQAMNQIAAAAKGSDDNGADESKATDIQSSEPSSKRRSPSRRRRTRRASSEEQTPETNDQPVISGRVTAAVKSETENQAPSTPAVDKAPVAQSASVERPKRPRRRRAASSETGEDTIQQANTEATSSGASFTATAPEKSEDKPKKKAATPVMLGVGVSADEISSPGRNNGQ